MQFYILYAQKKGFARQKTYLPLSCAKLIMFRHTSFLFPTFADSTTGCNQGRQELSDYQLFGVFTVTAEDAKEYLYSFSKTRRVHRFQSFKVNLYI